MVGCKDHVGVRGCRGRRLAGGALNQHLHLPKKVRRPRRRYSDSFAELMVSVFDMRQAAAAEAAGKRTGALNSSFSAFDYAPAKLDTARSFLMDDYLQSGRKARKHEPLQGPWLST